MFLRERLSCCEEILVLLSSSSSQDETGTFVLLQSSIENADLMVFSELFLSGYPPEDLVLRYSFLDEIDTYLKLLVEETKKPGPAVLVGLPVRDKNQIFNSVVLIDNGKIISIQHKCHLPNYDVFDEERIFNKGNLPGPINFRGLKIGVAICEDIWHEDVVECLAETGAEILIVSS